MARTEVAGRTRESVDPDDFSGGFALWSGTSFAAPIVAGRVARHLQELPAGNGGRTDREDAVARGRKAVSLVLGD